MWVLPWKVEPGCQTVTVDGAYLSQKINCTIPLGDGKVSFKAVYVPKNAASIRNNALDTGQMTILGANDPLYATTPRWRL